MADTPSTSDVGESQRTESEDPAKSFNVDAPTMADTPSTSDVGGCQRTESEDTAQALRRLQKAMELHKRNTEEALQVLANALEERLSRMEKRVRTLERRPIFPPSTRTAPWSIYSGGSLGETLLNAAKHGKPADVKRLLDAGADVNTSDPEGMTPLHWASATAHAFIVSQLLDKGANVNAKDAYSGTALHLAAAYDDSGKCLRLLIDAGADVNIADGAGNTPLHHAALRGVEVAAKALVAAGADTKVENKREKTPYDLSNDDSFKDILDGSTRRPNIPLGSSEKRDDLTTRGESNVVERRFLTAAKFGKPTEIRRLSDTGADVNAKDEEGMTALHWAAATDHAYVITQLLGKGAQIDLKDSYGRTALHLAASYDDNGKCVTQLIDAGADVNISDGLGNTPLHHAAMRGSRIAARALLDAGASKGVENKDRKTPSDLARESFLRQLLSDSSNAIPHRKSSSDDTNNTIDLEMLKAAKLGKPAEIRRLLDADADINASDSEGMTALHWAAATDHPYIVSQLMEKGASVEAKDKYGRTPLHLAASFDDSGKCVKELIKSGADVLAEDDSGNTPLHHSALRGSQAAAQALLDAGARRSAENKSGKTAFDLAEDDDLRFIL